MKHLLLLQLIVTLGFSNVLNINSFEADFKQTVTNDKNSTLEYSGHVSATKPQYALWHYKKPTDKTIYIKNNRATIVEPDLEQVIQKHINGDFDFFSMIQNAKKVNKNSYIAIFNKTKYLIHIEDNKIESLSYMDELENRINITFANQVQNREINLNTFIAVFPLDYDIIED